MSEVVVVVGLNRRGGVVGMVAKGGLINWRGGVSGGEEKVE